MGWLLLRWLPLGWLLLGWLLLGWLLLGWLLVGWLLVGWLLLGWLLLGWLLLGWLILIFSLNKTPLGETGCLSNPSSFLIHPLCQHSQLDHLWLPTPRCAALVRLTGRYAMPLVTKCFPLNPYLGKWRISLGVTSILSMCLHPHT